MDHNENDEQQLSVSSKQTRLSQPTLQSSHSMTCCGNASIKQSWRRFRLHEDPFCQRVLAASIRGSDETIAAFDAWRHRLTVTHCTR